MPNIEDFIEGSEKLNGVFGYWPSFHDAEVLELNLWRGDVDPDNGKYIFPVLTVKFHVYELTNEPDSQGFLVLRHHTLATMRFHEVVDFAMSNFDHINSIYELSISRQERKRGPSPFFAVRFSPGFGIQAGFECLRLEVLEAVACDTGGKSIV